MYSRPHTLTGVVAFTGAGYDHASLADPSLVYVVPADRRAQLIYVRAGNSSAALAYVALVTNGRTTRLFPVGAQAAMHVQLSIVPDLEPGDRIELHLAAAPGESGTLVIDLGFTVI